mgnify:CR=1 FL=1
MNPHNLAMEITKLEHAKKHQVNIAEATAVVWTLAHLLRARNVFSALWLAFRLRRVVK